MKIYGTLELTDASPAQTFTEVLSSTEVKTYLRITDSSPVDSDQDDLIDSLIAAARETAEIMQGIDLIQKQYDLHLDLLADYELLVGLGIDDSIHLRHPLQSVDTLQYTDSDGATTTLTENTDYVVDTNRSLVTPVYGSTWPFFEPSPSSSVLIRFTSGYASDHPFWSNAGKRIKTGMLLLISQWFDERLPIVPGQISELPYSVTALLGYGARPRVF